MGLVRGKYILAGLHASEASYVSSSSLSACRAAFFRVVGLVRCLWLTLAVLNLLDGPVGVGPPLHFVWIRFRMMRPCLAYCLRRNLGFSECWI